MDRPALQRLLADIEAARVLVIGTTNRPHDIDPAILRPGRVDRKVFIGPPDARGRAALFAKLLSRMPVADDIRPGHLARLTPGLSGAQVEHVANEAGLLAVKEALSRELPGDAVRIRLPHFLKAIDGVRGYSAGERSSPRRARASSAHISR